MNSFPTERQRRSQAFQHEQEMIAKYTAIHGLEKAIDYHWWHRRVENEKGNQTYSNYEHDYPKPYSNNYLTYFIEIFFRKGSETNLLFHLDNDFIGDGIDAEYIESLLISVKDYGLFEPEAALILNYGGVGGSITYGPPPNGGQYIGLAEKFKVDSYDIYIGSELNIERAELIRRWLKRRSNELESQHTYHAVVAAPETPKSIFLIKKYYPSLGKQFTTPILPELAAEWYSDLAVLGIERIEHYAATPYESASNKVEFLSCLDILLTEAEKYSHMRGYGYRQYFAPSDLTASKEAQLEASGNAALRAVRNWHTEASLPPVERFVHRACKIELWQNDQHQLTTLGLDDEDWRGIYNKLFIGLRRALYHTDEGILRTAYTELGLLLPTLHTRWMPQLDEFTDEENTANNSFFPSDLGYRLPYCEFVPLQPLSIVSAQRDVCLMAWLMTHINVKEWYVWQALKLLAGRLKESEPETPDSFKPRIQRPTDLEVNQILTSKLFSISDTRGLSYSNSEQLAPLLLNYTEKSLTTLLVELGLLDAGTKQATPAASPGAWVGVIHALLDAEPPRARDNKAALGRALHEVFGADLKERTAQAGLGKNGSQAEKVRDRALTILKRG